MEYQITKYWKGTNINDWKVCLLCGQEVKGNRIFFCTDECEREFFFGDLIKDICVDRRNEKC